MVSMIPTVVVGPCSLAVVHLCLAVGAEKEDHCCKRGMASGWDKSYHSHASPVASTNTS